MLRRAARGVAGVAVASSGARAEEEHASTCRLGTSWTKCPLQRVLPVNHDTSILVFRTPRDDPLDLPVCGCVTVRAPGREHGGGDAIRPYTPIAEARSFERLGLEPARSPGEFALLVKRYREWGYAPVGRFETEAFRRSYRPAGAVSNYLHERPDHVEFAHANENCKLRYPFGRRVERINMIAVGAGIAPMIQALERLLFTPGDDRPVVLLYGNRAVDDVLLRDTLDRWAAQFPHRLTVVYVVGSRYANVQLGMKRRVKRDRFATTHADLAAPPELPGFDRLPLSPNQKREPGWIGHDTIKRHAFPPHPSVLTFVCGLPEVYASLCGPRDDPALPADSVLATLGYDEAHVLKL